MLLSHRQIVAALLLLPITLSTPVVPSTTPNPTILSPIRRSVLQLAPRRPTLSLAKRQQQDSGFQSVSSDAAEDIWPLFDDDTFQYVLAEIKGLSEKYKNAGSLLTGVELPPPDAGQGGGNETETVIGMKTGNSTASGPPLPKESVSSHTGTGTTSHSLAPETVSAHSVNPTSATGPVDSAPSTAPSSAPSSSRPIHKRDSPTSSNVLFTPSTSEKPDSSSLSTPDDSTEDDCPDETPFLRDSSASDLHRRVIGDAKVPMKDFFSKSLDVLYFTDIELGTPGQLFQVDVDTGSSDLWMPSNCSNCGKNTQFLPDESTTYLDTGKPFSVTYGTGTVSGKLVQDTVSIGGLSVPKQYWGAVTSQSSDFLRNPNQGLIGMAFSALANSGKTPFFENLIANKAVTSPMFSVYLTRKTEDGAQLCLGCFDSTKYSGSVSWAPVVSKTYWSVSLTGITANGKANAVKQSIVGAVDTGTTLIYVPAKVADAFFKQIPGSKPAQQYGNGMYTFPCASTTKVLLSINNRGYSVDPIDFNLGKTSSKSTECVAAVLSLDTGFPDNLSIIGDAFLKSWYTIFDYSNNCRVGFAQAAPNGEP